MQLQRKLQEKELFREQKKKIQVSNRSIFLLTSVWVADTSLIASSSI